MLDLLNAMFSLTVCWPDIAEIRGVRISQGCFRQRDSMVLNQISRRRKTCLIISGEQVP